jgi:hypothetical protein
MIDTVMPAKAGIHVSRAVPVPELLDAGLRRHDEVGQAT